MDLANIQLVEEKNTSPARPLDINFNLNTQPSIRKI